MATARRFALRVVGEGRNRVSGVLAFVVPQALDLLSATTYVVSLSETPAPAVGVMRLHRLDQFGNVGAVWEPNPNSPHSNRSAPSWTADVITLGRSLGRTITWEPAQTQ